MLILGLVLDAAIVAVILVAMTEEFPGWGALVGAVFAVGVVSGFVGSWLPWPLSLVGLVAGAAAGGAVLAWTGTLSFERAWKAMGIYLAARVVMTLVGSLVFGT